MKYTKYILSIVIPFGFMYLIGCLTFESFWLSSWSSNGRVLIGSFASAISVYLLIHNIALDASKIDVKEIWVYGAKIVKK